ncbi:hypothetical protein HMPREF1979_02122 [Actinomyces johnsonii F0542]|uniref:Uncharacterized protein n=1 Tax=Actinomyces johnsonii F0542 TaxID=1321818 RepID=U1RTC3_9ACTO|nr:hypothetical protein HMPREF1979_02122 [Actinomyces johnsonii F0542]
MSVLAPSPIARFPQLVIHHRKILTVRGYPQSPVRMAAQTPPSRWKRNRDNSPHEPHDRPYFLS